MTAYYTRIYLFMSLFHSQCHGLLSLRMTAFKTHRLDNAAALGDRKHINEDCVCIFELRHNSNISL